MEPAIAGTVQSPVTVSRLFQAVGPVLLISMGYIDLGKWAAVVEWGACFGFDFVLPLLIINWAAVLCQYLAARIGVTTGKNLAQIYSEEYDKYTCFFFGVQAELSVIISDLTMILGVAQGLNLLLGLDFGSCVLLTAVDIILFPLFTAFLEKWKAEVYVVISAGLVLLFYVAGVLMSQPEVSLAANGMLTSFSGDSSFILMSLLGASIMPHNFYFHSSIVQQQQKPTNMSQSALCHDHFVAILCIFSGIYMANYVLMSSAATFFYNADLVVLSFQDALLLMDQVFRSPIAPLAFFLVLLISSEITALTWNIGGQVVLREFFRLDTPVWLHRSRIRILAIVPALYFAWSAGAEGIYKLLIFCQIILAMLLPSSVIPLFRVASSESIMGSLKISSFLEFLTLSSFMGMLGLKIIFVVEILFGSSDSVGSLKWNAGDSMSFPYVVLLTVAFSSLAFLIGLAVTPLKSEGVKPNDQIWHWDLQAESSVEDEAYATTTIRFSGNEDVAEEPAQEKSVESSDNLVVEFDIDYSETVMGSIPAPQPSAFKEIHAIGQISTACDPEKSTSTIDSNEVVTIAEKVPDIRLLDDASSETIKTVYLPTHKTEVVDLQVENDEGGMWEPEKSPKVVSVSRPTFASEGSGSFRSLSGKYEGGTGSGSLSRLCGLGRAPRRQLASILDEFWGQLYDFHGQATEQAKTRKLDVLLKRDSKAPNSLKSLRYKLSAVDRRSEFMTSSGASGARELTASPTVGHAGLESSRYIPSAAERGSEFLISSTNGSPEKFTSLSYAGPALLKSSRYVQSAAETGSEFLTNSSTYGSPKSTSLLNVGPAGLGSSGHIPLVAKRGSEFVMNSSTYDPSNQQRILSGLDSSLGIHTGSPFWSKSMQFLDASAQSPSQNVVEHGEKRYCSWHLPPSSQSLDYQLPTMHGYQMPSSYLSRVARERNSGSCNIHVESPYSTSSSISQKNYMDQLSYALFWKPQNGITSVDATSLQNPVVSRTNRSKADQSCYDRHSDGLAENIVGSPPYRKKYHSLPDISGLMVPPRDAYGANNSVQWGDPGYGPSMSGKGYGQSYYSGAGSKVGIPSEFGQRSQSIQYRNALSVQSTSDLDNKSLWSRQPFEQLFGMSDDTQSVGSVVGSRSSLLEPQSITLSDLEAVVLQSFRYCLIKLVKLDGSDWLFSLNGGLDEYLIDQVAARERLHNEVETKHANWVDQMCESLQDVSSDRMLSSAVKSGDTSLPKVVVSSFPYCGENCIWRKDLVVSFGVWCIRRILELSLMESRPELWGKYTYVLNRLQGVLELAFSKPRTPMSPCKCLQIPATEAKRSSPPVHNNGILPPAAKPGKGKCTTASSIIEMIKDVEIAVSCRKGRTGTAAGDVAFPKGKENLASVLKRYKRRLSIFSMHEGGSVNRRS